MLPISTLTASLLGFLFFILTMRVIKERGNSKVSLGDGGEEMLIRRIRAQGNFVEYVPLFLILLVLAEYNGSNVYFLGMLAAIFVFARTAHGYALAFTEKSVKARFHGTLFTGIPIIVLSVFNFWIAAKFYLL